jgi:DNA-binding response OmpR family regulator
METTVLLIEDENKVASFIKKGLEENSYHVSIASDGDIGISLAQNMYFDVVILDVRLGDTNGFEVCKAIRENNKIIPILMLTALGSISDKLQGFQLGADDYLVKPFEFDELLARMKALTKRTKFTQSESSTIRIADLELNTETKVVKRKNKVIELTAKEFFLLEYMVKNRDKVISRQDIAQNIWNIYFDTGTNVIDVYVNFLRKKIDKGFEPKLIHTVVGMGYILKSE